MRSVANNLFPFSFLWIQSLGHKIMHDPHASGLMKLRLTVLEEDDRWEDARLLL